MSKKPAVVLVHGFWGGAAHWGKVIPSLSHKGYADLHAVENPLTSLADDAERTRKMVAQIKGPVILAGHSYGGAVITEMGDLPNVAALVYVAAFAPDAGESLAAISQVLAPPGGASIGADSDGYLWVAHDQFAHDFCHDLPADEALVMAVTQKAPLASTFHDAVQSPAWKRKPSWYQVSNLDRMIHPDNERRMAARIGARQVITLEASHASLASRPADIAELIDIAARETTGA